MTNFEKIGCIAFIFLFIFGFKPAIKNFLIVYRNHDGKLSKGMHIFTTIYFGLGVISMPLMVALLMVLLIRRTSLSDYIFW